VAKKPGRTGKIHYMSDASRVWTNREALKPTRLDNELIQVLLN